MTDPELYCSVPVIVDDGDIDDNLLRLEPALFVLLLITLINSGLKFRDFLIRQLSLDIGMLELFLPVK